MATHPNALMSQLVYEPDQAMQNMLNRFIQEYVFCEEEDGKYLFVLLKNYITFSDLKKKISLRYNLQMNTMSIRRSKNYTKDEIF